jgi:DivIVA domain-containing protein
VELDRHYIERKDFTVARRGYDQAEVDLHLRQLADTITELRAQLKASPAGVAGAAAEQVRQIVEAAEESAAQIEERATEEARRVTDDASRRARETRERADRESAEQLERVQETASKMVERADALSKELAALIQGIQEEAGALVDRMRGGAAELEAELASIRKELVAVRPAEPEPEEPLTVDRSPSTELPAAAPPEPSAPAPQPEPAPEPAAVPAERSAVNGERSASEVPASPEGARLVALNMALNGTPREEAARYLADNFELEDQDAILDDVYSRIAGR